MTTVLISVYLYKLKKRKLLSVLVLLVFGIIEAVFFISSLGKFLHGGYFTVILTMLLLSIMVVWYRSTWLERHFCTELKLEDHVESLKNLRNDEDIPLLTHNLVYMDKGTSFEYIDRDILYSILDKDQKRAMAYWIVSVNVLDEPYTSNYQVETYGTDFLFRIRLNLGFKCHQRVNVYLRQIVQELLANGELPKQDKKYSIYGPSDIGTFKFCFIHKSVSTKTELTTVDEAILNTKYFIRRIAGSKIKWYGLDTSSLIVEYVPLIIGGGTSSQRIQRLTEASDKK